MTNLSLPLQVNSIGVGPVVRGVLRIKHGNGFMTMTSITHSLTSRKNTFLGQKLPCGQSSRIALSQTPKFGHGQQLWLNFYGQEIKTHQVVNVIVRCLSASMNIESDSWRVGLVQHHCSPNFAIKILMVVTFSEMKQYRITTVKTNKQLTITLLIIISTSMSSNV